MKVIAGFFLSALFVLSSPIYTSGQLSRINPQKFAAIKEVVDEIKKDSVESIIRHLENFGSRFLNNPNRLQLANWIKNKFISYGYDDVTIDTVECNFSFGNIGRIKQYNVIAKLTGTSRPNDYYITCGHYDSFTFEMETNPLGAGPGADDNASGTAAVLESARVIKLKNYQPASSILFIAFAAEELMYFGNSGAETYAARTRSSNMNIKLLINNDMIANSLSPADQSKVFIYYYQNSSAAAEAAKNATTAYSVVAPVLNSSTPNADQYPFFQAGYPAIFFMEKDFSYNYHTGFDLSYNLNMEYCKEVIKASCASLLSYQETTTSIEHGEKIPTGFVLCQNYPNPFNPITTIKYSKPETQFVSLKVFDMLGREIETLVNEEKSPGNYQIQFNGSNLSSGTYIYRLAAGNFNTTKKFTLLK